MLNETLLLIIMKSCSCAIVFSNPLKNCFGKFNHKGLLMIEIFKFVLVCF